MKRTFETYAPMSLNALAFRRRLDATDRYVRDDGMSKECNMGLSV